MQAAGDIKCSINVALPIENNRQPIEERGDLQRHNVDVELLRLRRYAQVECFFEALQKQATMSVALQTTPNC